MDQLQQYYEQLDKLTRKMRLAQWNAHKYGGKSERDKAWRLGLEIDKIIRAETKRREDLKKQIENG